MRIRSVAGLAALSMLLTSYSVWSWSGRDPDTRPERGRWTPPAGNGGGERPSAPGASFNAGRTLRVEGRLGHARLAAGDAAETFVLVDVHADEQATGRAARRHLAIAIDRSGSMSGKRLTNAIAAAQGAVRRVADGDVVSVIDYATTARVLVPPTTLDSASRDRIVAEIGRMAAGGNTCISCALETSIQVLRERSGSVDRVLLVSDGEATTGVLEIDGMRRVADRVRDAGATVTTIGVDVDYNERMLAAISQETNGRHYFVENPDGLASIFDRELNGLERAVAREARLELELAPGVELLDVPERSFTREGSRVIVSLGSFSAGEERSVLARVRLTSGAPGDRPVATARLEYDDLGSGSHASSEGALALRLTDDGSSSPLDPIVEARVQRSGTVTALSEAGRLFEAGDGERARRTVADKLDEVRRERVTALALAPEPKKASVGRDFDRQESALGAAATAFAEPPPAASAAPDDLRQGKAALKRNQAEASELAF